MQSYINQYFCDSIACVFKQLLLFCLSQDYVTIVPVFYPGPRGARQEAQKQGEYILNDFVTRPCEVNGREKLDDLCIQYSYVGVNKPGFVKVQAVRGFANSATGEKPTQVFQDRDVLKELDFSELALLNEKQVFLLEKNKRCRTPFVRHDPQTFGHDCSYI